MRIDWRFDAAASGLEPDVFASGGCARPWLDRLLCDPVHLNGPDLADAIHGLAQLHGGTAGLVDIVSLKVRGYEERAFLIRVLEAWQCERRALAILMVAAGPRPSVNGSDGDAAVSAALSASVAALGSSDRIGVGLGATAALLVEWHALRPLLDRAALRFTAAIPRCDLPDVAELSATVAGFVDGPATGRAVAFGAQQLLHQHRAFATMLERRALARQPV